MVTFRGLTKGFQDTPLVEFKGRLESFEPRIISSPQYGESTIIDLNFRDVEVIKSKEPYQFPIAQIGIRYSDREGSAWGIFALSCTQFMREDQDIESLKGLELHMLRTPGHEFGTDRVSGEPIIRDCWECQGIEGMESGGAPSVSPQRRALELLDDNSEQDFNQKVFADQLVKSDADLTQTILGRTFITAMEEQGIVAKGDDDTFKVDWEKAPS